MLDEIALMMRRAILTLVLSLSFAAFGRIPETIDASQRTLFMHRAGTGPACVRGVNEKRESYGYDQTPGGHRNRGTYNWFGFCG